MIRFNKIFYGAAATIVATVGLASCTNELNEADFDLGNGNTVANINLVKNPQMIAYSGGKTLGNSVSAYNTRGEESHYGDYNNYGYANRCMPNANQWGTEDDGGKYLDYPRPADITDAERQKVLDVFNQKGKEYYEPLVDWSHFFVQQVYCGPEGPKMTELACVVDYNVEVVSWWPYEEKIIPSDPMNVIINNFNNGAYGGDTQQGCMLVFNGSTSDWSFRSTQGGGERFGNWRMEWIDGAYYIGFDFQSNKQGSDANENEYAERDYIYNDWIIKIVPGKGVDTSTPPANQDGKDEVEFPTTSEVEVNLSINDVHDGNIEDFVSKLSIHVRYANDVKITLPVPAGYYVDADDLYILHKHEEGLFKYGSEHVAAYEINGKTVTLTVKYDAEGITVTTKGIDQTVFDYCVETYHDGLNFEVYNYYVGRELNEDNEWVASTKLTVEELQKMLDGSTIEFINDKGELLSADACPDYYINAFGNRGEFNGPGASDGSYNPTVSKDCSVKINDNQKSDFDKGVEGAHLNNSELNVIYKNNTFDGDAGEHDHEFLWGDKKD